MKHLIKIESTPHGVLGVRHAGLDQQYCEAGELVTLKWQPDAKWGLQEAHYTDGDGNIVPIDLGNGNGVVAFMMPDKDITLGGTFKMFVSQDWTEGTNPSKGEVLTVGNNGEPTPISVDELANQITEGDNDLVDAIDRINPFKGWYTDIASLQNNHPSPQIGDYAYVKGAESTDPVAIYECTTNGSWSDSGRTADTSNVQTFASGEEVNGVHIVNDLTTGGVGNVLSAEQGKSLSKNIIEKGIDLYGYKGEIIDIAVDIEQNVYTSVYKTANLKKGIDYIFVVDHYESSGTVDSNYYKTSIRGFFKDGDLTNKIPYYMNGSSTSSTDDFPMDNSDRRTRTIRLSEDCNEIRFTREVSANVYSGTIYFKFVEIGAEKGITQKTETVDNTNAFNCKQHIVENRPYYFDDTFSGIDSYTDTSYLDRKILDVPEGKHFIFNTDSHIDYGSSTSIDPDGIGYGHLQKETEIMKYVKERLGIRNVIFGGDAIGGRNSKYEAAKILSLYCNDKFNAFGSDFLYCQGNHDANYPQWLNRPSDSTLVESDVIISDSEIYKRTTRNMALYGKAVFDEVMLSAVDNTDFIPYVDANTGLDTFGYTATQLKEEFKAWAMLHYYYDDDVQKIRYIVLETGDYSHAYRTLIGTGSHVSMDLLNDFVSRSLLSVPNNYDVVIVGHQFYYPTDNSNNYNTYRSLDAWIHFYMIVDAYMHKTSTSYVCRAGDASSLRYNLYPKLIFKNINSNRPYDEGSYRKYSFKNRKGSGRVFTISGHYHANDAYMTSFSIISDALRISHTEYDGVSFQSNYILNIMFDRCVSNGQSESWVGNEHPYATSYPNDTTAGTGDMEQRLGTVKEVLFDVVTITPDNRVVCTRFGAGSTGDSGIENQGNREFILSAPEQSNE